MAEAALKLVGDHPEGAPDKMDRASAEARREDIANRLSMAIQLKEQRSAAAFRGEISPEKVVEAARAVEGLQLQLEGHGVVLREVERQEDEQKAAEMAAARRKAAIDIVAHVHLRYWQTSDLDEALEAVDGAATSIDKSRQHIISVAARWFDTATKRGEGDLHNFLMGIHAFDMTDTVWKLRNHIGQTRRYSNDLPFGRTPALRALAKALPEVLDEDVQAEALALAEKLRADGGEQPSD